MPAATDGFAFHLQPPVDVAQRLLDYERLSRSSASLSLIHRSVLVPPRRSTFVLSLNILIKYPGFMARITDAQFGDLRDIVFSKRE